jgi:hypothetical protein
MSYLERDSQELLYRIKENYFHGAFEAWEKLWNWFIHPQGDYFEGDGSRN